MCPGQGRFQGFDHKKSALNSVLETKVTFLFIEKLPKKLRIESYDVLKPKSGKTLKYGILPLIGVFQFLVV